MNPSSVTIQEIQQRLAHVLVTRVVRVDALSVAPDTPLVKKGLNLDSVALLEFIVGIEQEFGIALDDSAVTVEHFASIATLAEYVHQVITARNDRR